MEDLLSQCSPNVEEYLTRLTKWLVVIRSKYHKLNLQI